MKYSEIKLKVGLNEHKVPQDIKWKATDSEQDQFKDSKAFNLSIWDPVESNVMSINLWTDNMQTDEMHAFFFRTILQQADSYATATGNPFAQEMTKEFVQNLAKKTSDWINEQNT